MSLKGNHYDSKLIHIFQVHQIIASRALCRCICLFPLLIGASHMKFGLLSANIGELPGCTLTSPNTSGTLNCRYSHIRIDIPNMKGSQSPRSPLPVPPSLLITFRFPFPTNARRLGCLRFPFPANSGRLGLRQNPLHFSSTRFVNAKRLGL